MRPAKDFVNVSCQGYVNVNQVIPNIADQLHPVETLYGDLEAKLLVLGQDPMHYPGLVAGITTLPPGTLPQAAYRHGNLVTNAYLAATLQPYLARVDQTRKVARTNRNCGVFYGNAVWLLKDTPTINGTLINLPAALTACEPVLQATISGLEKLEAIWAVGAVAYSMLQRVDRQQNHPSMLTGRWRESIGVVQMATLFNRSLQVFTTGHPSGRPRIAQANYANQAQFSLRAAGLI